MTTFDGDQPPLAPTAGLWPAGHRAALCVTIAVSGAGDETAQLGPDLEVGYERAGAERLLRLLADTAVAATFAWSRSAAATDEDLMAQVRDGGHEIAARIDVSDGSGPRSPDLSRIRDQLSRLAGGEVTGVSAADAGDIDALARSGQEAGFRWVLSGPAGDQPILLRPNDGLPPIVHLPASRWFDDRHLFGDPGRLARHAFEACRDDLDTIRDEGSLMILRLHPSVSGRPGPSRAIAQFLDHAIDTGDLWITRADHLALWWSGRHGSG